MGLKAPQQLKRNIDALLAARHLKRKDLALWCHRTEAWLSQIFTNEDRGLPLKYLDRIADFFRLQPYQLFQPGLIPETDRRRGHERRSGDDRRVTVAEDILQEAPPWTSLETRVRKMPPEAYRRFARRVEAALTLAEPTTDAPTRLALPPATEPPPAKPVAQSPRNPKARKKPPN